jgi:integrase
MHVRKDIRHIVGTARLRHSLGRVDDRTAKALARPHITRFERQLEEAEKVHAGNMTADEYGLAWKHADLDAETIDFLAFNNEYALGKEAAQRAGAIAKGELLPLRLYEEEWLRGLKLPKTRQEFGSILAKCEAFLKTRKADALNRVTDGDVMAWRSELQKTMADSTINKKMTCMSSYFEHVKQHGVIKDNPFRGKWLEVEAERKRRRFTLEEVAILFDNADAKMRDEMALALLGMRISEQWNLQVRHVETIDGMTALRVPGTKTDAAARTIVAPDVLLPVIGRLTAGKKPVDYLCEAPPAAKLKSRGSEPGRRWMRWLREVQKDHSLPDEVDWHSWRRLAAWLMETADVPESTAARILGHSSRLGLSYGLYAGKAELKKLKAAADSAMGVLPASVLKHLKVRKVATSATEWPRHKAVP